MVKISNEKSVTLTFQELPDCWKMQSIANRTQRKTSPLANQIFFSYREEANQIEFRTLNCVQRFFRSLFHFIGLSCLAYSNTFFTQEELTRIWDAYTRVHSRESMEQTSPDIPSTEPPEKEKNNSPTEVISPVSSTEPLMTPSVLDSENERLFQEINGIASRIKLPKPVEDASIIHDIAKLTPRQTLKILVQPETAPSNQHLQAIRFLNVMGQSQKTNLNQILPHVFLGNYEAFRSVDPSKGNPQHFTRVISVTAQDANSSNEFVRVCVPKYVHRIVKKVNDEETAWIELETDFETLFQFIDTARLAKENILIHCSQGQSRSATVLIAYLINRFHVTFEDAMVFLKTKRFLVDPIPGLQKKLALYEKRILS